MSMHTKSISELRAALDSKAISSVELTQQFLKRNQQFNPELNALITLTEDLALTQAAAADVRIAKGDIHALTGIPVIQKDIFCTKGIKTTCGSKMLDNFISPYDATVIEKFNDAGAVTLGKANMDEFAMGSSNENSFYGPSKNPWDTSRVPGGSSGGSASAVAACLAPAATGTDTGGSIRQPAALCNLTGLKPTYGLVSRFGMIAFASSLDQGGPMTRNAKDCAILMNTMAGFDEKDSTSLQRAVPDYTSLLEQDLTGLRVGLVKEFMSSECHPDIANALTQTKQQLEKLGAQIVEVSLPNINLSLPAYYIIAPAEASSNLSRYDGVRYGYRCEEPRDLEDLYKRSRGEGFGNEVKRRILIGTYALSAGYYDAYYIKAQKIRRLIRDDFMAAFNHVDVILSPTTPTTAFKIGEKSNDPVSMYLSDIYTIPVNLAGLPAISFPVGFSQGLPVGAQLIGNYFSESHLLNIVNRYQRETSWHLELPQQYK